MFNFILLFTNTIMVKHLTFEDYANCALTALGFTIFYALYGLSETSWKIPALKKVFSDVVKRVLSPIGITVAVLSFVVLCILKSK